MGEEIKKIAIAATVAPLSLLILGPFGVVGLFFAYPTMLIFGLPAFILLRYLRLDSIWSALIIGFLAVPVAVVLLHLESGVELVRQSIRPEIAYSNLRADLASPIEFIGLLNLPGSLVGIVFWLIVDRFPWPSRQPVDEANK